MGMTKIGGLFCANGLRARRGSLKGDRVGLPRVLAERMEVAIGCCP